MALEVTMDEGLDASSVSLETAGLNMGSTNFGILELLWKSGLDPDFLATVRDLKLPGTVATIVFAVGRLGHVHDTKLWFECHDSGHVCRIGQVVDRGPVRRPSLSSLHCDPWWCRHRCQKHALGGADAA